MKVMNTQTYDAIRKLGVGRRSARRRWVLLTLTGLVLYALLTLLDAAPWTIILALLLYVFGVYKVVMLIGLLDSRSDSSLDERQRISRDRAHRQAFPFVSWYIVSLLLILGLRPELFATALAAPLFSLGLLVIVLPSFIIAWTEPDPPMD